MKNEIIESLKQIIKDEFSDKYVDHVELNKVTNSHINADYYCNIAMKLAKDLKINPEIIANQILKKIKIQDGVNISVAKPGYINFDIDKNIKNNLIYDIYENADLLSQFKTDVPKNIHIEFVSANPTGPLHVGHGRGAIFGNILKNFLKVQGHKVHSEYYINNVGNQMNKLWVSVKFKHKDFNLSSIGDDDLYKGEYLDDVYKIMTEKLSGNFEDIDETMALNLLCDIMIDNFIKPDLDSLGIHFDTWFKESNLIEDDSVKNILSDLKKSGAAVEVDGALMLKADELRALIKSNGDLTYFASDLAYHHKKMSEYDLVIDIWGADHHGYVPRIREGLKKLGHNDDKLIIKLIQFANLYKNKEKISMSTRKGTFVTLKKLADEIGNDAIYFFYITKNCNQHLDFDLDLALSHDKNNPVYYIQYAHARIEKILNQLEPLSTKSFDPSLLNEQEDLKLIDQLNKYYDVFKRSIDNLEPHVLANYLYDLASSFHSYYASKKIISDDINYSRVFLIYSVQKILKNGLNILHVNAPKEM